MRNHLQQPEPDPIPRLDCGHPESAHGANTRGYATLPDDTRVCYACAEAREKADLLTHDTYTAYLTSKTPDGRTILSGWPGWELAHVVNVWTTTIGGFMGRRQIMRFRAIDVHGQHWYGTSPGFGMYARMHKTKPAK